MRWLGITEAFGKPWAHSLRGWMALFVPTSVLVVLQEADTPFPHFGLVLLSAVLQHCCAGLVVLPLVAVVGRRADVLPLWCVVASWTTGAMARALSGAAMVIWFTDADIGVLYRLVSWLIISWTWMPLLSYAVAQLEHRQFLLAARTEALHRRDEARDGGNQTAEQIRSRLVSDVSVATTLVITEIEAALEASRHKLDAHGLKVVGDRLSDVSGQARMAVARLSHQASDEPDRASQVAAPMTAALNFQREHPWRWSILSAVALAGVMLPVSYPSGGSQILGELAISLAVIAVTLALASRKAPWGASVDARKAVAWSAARHALAGLAGSCTLGIMRWGELDATVIAVLVVLPYGAAVAAEVLSATVGVANANRSVLDSIAELESDRRQLERAAVEKENQIRHELYDVMHGPILGRLSSCAMALNFLAAELGTVPSERIAAVTTAVLDHLNDTLHDLSLLKS